VSTEGFICIQILAKFNFRSGPRWGSLQRSSRSPAGGRGWLPLPQECHPASAFGLVFRPFGPQTAAFWALHRPVFL